MSNPQKAGVPLIREQITELEIQLARKRRELEQALQENINAIQAAEKAPPHTNAALLTVPQAAKYLSMSTTEVYRQMANGKLPSIVIGRRFRRISRKACDEWIERESSTDFTTYP